jgi:hypothetical protein
VKGLEGTFVKTSRSRLQIQIKHLDVPSIHFSVNSCGVKLANMVPGFDELRVIDQGLNNS